MPAERAALSALAVDFVQRTLNRVLVIREWEDAIHARLSLSSCNR